MHKYRLKPERQTEKMGDQVRKAKEFRQKQPTGKRKKKDKNERGGAETYKGINANDLLASSGEGTRLLG